VPQLQRWHFGMGVCRMWGVILRRSHLVLKKAARHMKHNARDSLSSSLLGDIRHWNKRQVGATSQNQGTRDRRAAVAKTAQKPGWVTNHKSVPCFLK